MTPADGSIDRDARGPEHEEEPAGGGLSRLFVQRPIATIMLMVGVLLIGCLAYTKLPISSLPNVNVATFLVTAEMSGADPQTSASAVTTPLET